MATGRHEIAIIVSPPDEDEDGYSVADRLMVTQIDESKHDSWHTFFDQKMFDNLRIPYTPDFEVHDKNAPFDKVASPQCTYNLKNDPAFFAKTHKSRTEYIAAKKKKKLARFTVKLVPKYGGVTKKTQ